MSMTPPVQPPQKTGWLERLRTSFAPEEAETGITTERGRKRAIALLFVCLIGNGLGQTLMFAILPPLARELGLTEFQVGRPNGIPGRFHLCGIGHDMGLLVGLLGRAQ